MGIVECRSFMHKAIQVRRANKLVPKRADGIPPLLVGTDPENIRPIGGTLRVYLLSWA